MTTLLYFALSAGVLALLSVFYLFEARAGERIVLSGVRAQLDRGLVAVARFIAWGLWSVWHFLVRTVLQFGVYQLLGSIVTRLIALEQRAERLIRQHRPRNGEKRNRNHLDEIADHKDAVALTERQKKKLRDT